MIRLVWQVAFSRWSSDFLTVIWTTTVNAGISSDTFSISAEFSTEKFVTSSLSTTYKVRAGQNGNIVWTPIMRYRDGVTTDCKNNEDNGQGVVMGHHRFQSSESHNYRE
ncbi:hypothetical protein VTO58DRAFT_111454 [Aureobasidium pullulans]